MTIEVTDRCSNNADQIVLAATIIGRSKQRQKVFLAYIKAKRPNL